MVPLLVDLIPFQGKVIYVSLFIHYLSPRYPFNPYSFNSAHRLTNKVWTADSMANYKKTTNPVLLHAWAMPCKNIFVIVVAAHLPKNVLLLTLIRIEKYHGQLLIESALHSWFPILPPLDRIMSMIFGPAFAWLCSYSISVDHINVIRSIRTPVGRIMWKGPLCPESVSHQKKPTFQRQRNPIIFKKKKLTIFKKKKKCQKKSKESVSYQKKAARPSFLWYDNDSGHKGPFCMTQPISMWSGLSEHRSLRNHQAASRDLMHSMQATLLISCMYYSM